jgi:hypothetical protein
MQYEDFVRSYAVKSDEELFRLQSKPEQLTQEASTALTSELLKRGIGADRLNILRDEEKRRQEELSRDPGNLFLTFRFGVGRWHFGKSGRIYNPATGFERFTTTVFILLLWLPLIPTGTYLIEKNPRFLFSKIRILKRLPLDWKQVTKVWAVAAAGILAVIWLFKRM